MQRRDEDGIETAAISRLVPLAGKRVLDVGCGRGRLTAFAAAHRARYGYTHDGRPLEIAAARVEVTGRAAEKPPEGPLELRPGAPLTLDHSRYRVLDEAPAVHEAIERESAGLEGRGRVLVRPSGTEPLVRVMVEAPTEGEAVEVCERLVAVVEAEVA